MTLAANRIVAGEGVMAWGVASLPVVLPGLAAIGAGLLMGLPAGRNGLRIAGAAIVLVGLAFGTVRLSAFKRRPAR